MAKRPRVEPLRNEDNTNDDSSNDGGEDNGCRKRGRGFARKPKQWGKTKLNVIFNRDGQPCGGDKDALATQIGVFVKNGYKLPLNVGWRQIADGVLDNIWKDVLDNTNAPLKYKVICYKQLNRSWRDWRTRVKRMYTCLKTDEARLAITPESVRRDQWVSLIAQWGSERSKKIADTNKKNRAKQEFLCRTGKKPHCQIRKEKEDKGEATDRLSMFSTTRTNNAGEILNLTTKNMIDTLQYAVNDLPEEERNSPSKREKIFIENLGKDSRGRLKLMSLGLTKSMVLENALAAETLTEVEEKLESQRLTMEAEMEKRLEAQKVSQEAEMEKRLEAQKVSQEADYAKRLEEFKEAQEAAQRNGQEDFQRKLMQLLQAANPGIVFPTI